LCFRHPIIKKLNTLTDSNPKLAELVTQQVSAFFNFPRKLIDPNKAIADKIYTNLPPSASALLERNGCRWIGRRSAHRCHQHERPLDPGAREALEADFSVSKCGE